MAIAARSTSEAETKPLGLPLRVLDAAGVFEGYASLFGVEDLGRDVVAPGAFRRSLSIRGADGVRMLLQHDPAQPLGVWERIHEDARGLFVRGRLALAAFKSREVHALMRAGAIDGLSIGFKAVKASTDRRTGVRRLTEIDLWEISIVTFPMQPAARICDVKCTPSRGTVATGPPIVAKLAEATRLLKCSTTRRRDPPDDPVPFSRRSTQGRMSLHA